MATVGTLIFEMSANVARLQQDMSKAQSNVKSTMDNIGSAVNTAKAALAALGIGFGMHELVNFVESGIASVAMLERLAQRTGLTVELLSSLRSVAAASRTDLDSMAGMVQKLDKNMLEFSTGGGGKAAAAFQRLGFSQADVTAGLKNMDSFLPEFARRLIATGGGAETVGLAMELLGKAGGNALPFLNALAATHELVATRTAEQAARAHELEVEMSKVSQRTLLLKEDFAIGLTPALMQTVTAFNELRKSGHGAVELGETLGTALRYVALVAGSLWTALTDIGNALGALAAQASALAHGDLAAVRAIGEERNQQLIATNKTLDALQESLLSTQATVAPAKAVAAAHEEQAAAAEATAVSLGKQMTAEELLMKQAAKRAEDMEKIDRTSDAMQAVTEKAAKVNDIGRALGMTFESAFENAAIKGKNFSDILKGIEQDIARIIIRQGITKPVAAAISNAMEGFSFAGLFGGGKASGGSVSPGMSYLVGENGPEILSMGASSGNITPSGGGGTTYIDARGADAMAVARIEAGLRQLNQSIEYRAVGAVQRAFNQRGALTPIG